MLKYTFIILFTISQICNAQNSSSIQPKSHSKAFLLSFISTAVPIGVGTGLILHSNNQAPVNYGEAVLGTTLGVFGVMFAPGLGHLYAQREKPFKGIYTRLIGVGIAGVGVIIIAAESRRTDNTSIAGFVIIGCGAGTILYSVFSDIISVQHSVTDYNNKFSLTITPSYLAHQKAPGIRINFLF